MDVEEMRLKFDNAIALLIKNKRNDNNFFFNNEEYLERIEQIKQSKITLATAGKKKCTKDYRNVRKYDVIVLDGKDILVKAVANAPERRVRYCVKNDELFDIIHSTHLAIDHGGRDRMIAELKYSYVNVTKETIMIYLSLCADCNKRSSKPRRNVESKPILHSAYNSRAIIDVIHIESEVIPDFQYILNYQDYLTKFVILKPLKAKCAKEIAHNLVDIFTSFGAQAILNSDEEKEFVCDIINELHTMWSDVKIVHGKPLPNMSQDNVEHMARVSRVTNLLTAWVLDNKNTDWPAGLKFVQYQLNCTVSPGTKKSPYEAMFGYPPRKGVASIGLPMDKINSLQSEEDIETILRVNVAQTYQPVSDSSDNEPSQNMNCGKNSLNNSHNSELEIDQQQQKLHNKRQIPLISLIEPAKKIMKRSEAKIETFVQEKFL